MAVIAAARLHRLAVRGQVIHLLCHLWNHLDRGTATIPGLTGTAPFTPPGSTVPLN